MINNNKHINNSKHENVVDNFFDKADVPYIKSKDEIWNKLVNTIDNKPNNTPIKKNGSFKLRFIYGTAATILIMAGLVSVLRYYNTTIKSASHQHISTTLPDGSTVNLTPNSTLTYYPLWWQISRQVALSGEAFFNVEKGKKFNVSSSLGKTIVLGTSFNIFSRGDEYSVTCVTGKVKVVSITRQQVILNPNYNAKLNKNGKIKISKSIYEDFNLSSTKDGFSFTSVPVRIVIEEIEDFYNVRITSQSELNYLYTGYFSKQKPVEEVLNLLCKPFGVTFIKKGEGNFEITQD